MARSGHANGVLSASTDSVRPVEAVLAAGAIALLVMLFFPGALADGIFYYRDLFRVHYPAKSFGLAAVRATGSLPWWNPSLSCGQPFLADPNYTVFYPTNLLYLALPFGRAFNLHILVHYFLSGLFTYFLGRRLRLPPPAALVSAVALAFGGFSLSLANFYNAAASAAYTPLIILLLLCGCRRRGVGGSPVPLAGARLRTAALAAAGGLALALQFLGGEPVYLVFGATALLVCAAAGVATGRLDLRRTGLFLLLAAVLSAAVAAVQLLPAVDLVAHTGRGGGFTLEQASRWSVHPLRLSELLIPGLFGDVHSLDYWGFWGHAWFDGNFPYIISVYAGVGVLMLSGLALFNVRRRVLSLLLLGGAAVAVLMALGDHGPLYPLFHRLVPGAAVLRYPVKFLHPACICLALLAGIGAERLWRGGKGDPVGGITMSWSPELICGAVLLAAFTAGRLLLYFQLDDFQGWLARSLLQGRVFTGAVGGAAAGMAGALTRSLNAAIGISALLTLALLLRGRLQRPLAWAVTAAVMLDLLSALGGLNRVAPSDFYDLTGEPLTAIRRLESGPPPRGMAGDPFRLYHDSGKEPPSVTLKAPANDRIWHFLWMRRNLFPLTAPLEYAFDPDWDEMYLRPTKTAAAVLRALPLNARGRYLGIFNVRYVIAFRDYGDPSLEEVGRWGGESNLVVRLFRNNACLPRVYWVPTAQVCRDERMLVQILADPGFNPTRRVLLLKGPGQAPPPDQLSRHHYSWDSTRCRITARDPLRVTVEADCPGPGYVVLAESYAPEWRAVLDGREAAVLRANLALRAVRVEGGRHRLAFEYHPRWRVAGPLVSLAGILAAVSIFLVALRSSRQ